MASGCKGQPSSNNEQVVTAPRSYGQFCGLARALDLVGERWALLIVRDLLLGPRRFTDLRHSLPGIGTNILAARLRELERAGVVCRRTLPPPAASAVYELTEYGAALEEPLLALGRWGARTLGPREPGQALRGEWLAVALKAMFAAEAAGDLTATVELRIGDGAFALRIEHGALRIDPGPAAAAELTVAIDEDRLLAFLSGHLPADQVAFEGDAGLLRRLPRLFPMTPAAA
jgi:DNA-binding HxlR family transcriptional regulator